MKYKYIQQYNYCDQKGVITVDFTFDFDQSLTKFDFSSSITQANVFVNFYDVFAILRAANLVSNVDSVLQFFIDSSTSFYFTFLIFKAFCSYMIIFFVLIK